MVHALIVLAPPPVRDLRPGLERKYRVSIVRAGGDEYAYRLRAKVAETKEPKGEKGALRLDLRLTDYRATVSERRVSQGLIGGGLMPLEPTGLPGGLSIVGPQGPIWLPLLSLYLPTQDDFTVPKIDLGGVSLAGKGKIGEKGRIEIDGTISRDDRELGKLTLATSLDAKGWPLKAEGSLVSADGTYRFTLEKA